MYKMGTIIGLSDKNEYMITSAFSFDKKNIYMLVDNDNPSNVKICFEEKDAGELEEIEDGDFIKTLLPYFAEATKNYLEEVE